MKCYIVLIVALPTAYIQDWVEDAPVLLNSLCSYVFSYTQGGLSSSETTLCCPVFLGDAPPVIANVTFAIMLQHGRWKEPEEEEEDIEAIAEERLEKGPQLV